jgi:hypothetical protein
MSLSCPSGYAEYPMRSLKYPIGRAHALPSRAALSPAADKGTDTTATAAPGTPPAHAGERALHGTLLGIWWDIVQDGTRPVSDACRGGDPTCRVRRIIRTLAAIIRTLAAIIRTLAAIIRTLAAIIRTLAAIIRTLAAIIRTLAAIIRTLAAIIRTLAAIIRTLAEVSRGAPTQHALAALRVLGYSQCCECIDGSRLLRVPNTLPTNRDASISSARWK